LEALLMKVATERKLTQEQIEDLGLFREAFQQLRKSIRDLKDLTFGTVNPRQYMAFKRGAVTLIAIVSTTKRATSPQFDQFIAITERDYEAEWEELAGVGQASSVAHQGRSGEFDATLSPLA
jgi:hypothetical protein